MPRKKKEIIEIPGMLQWNRRNALARAVFDAWPLDGLVFNRFWNSSTGVPVEGGGDTLLLFVLREMKDTVDFNGSSFDAMATMRGVVEQAINDLDGLDDNLMEFASDDKKRRKTLWR